MQINVGQNRLWEPYCYGNLGYWVAYYQRVRHRSGSHNNIDRVRKTIWCYPIGTYSKRKSRFLVITNSSVSKAGNGSGSRTRRELQAIAGACSFAGHPGRQTNNQALIKSVVIKPKIRQLEFDADRFYSVYHDVGSFEAGCLNKASLAKSVSYPQGFKLIHYALISNMLLRIFFAAGFRVNGIRQDTSTFIVLDQNPG